VLETETPLTPTFLAGHSLGEYSALVASGALSFADALRTVRARGTFMQEAVPVGVGAMAAILGAEADAIAQICEEAAQGEVVSPANFNSPEAGCRSGRDSEFLRPLCTADLVDGGRR